MGVMGLFGPDYKKIADGIEKIAKKEYGFSTPFYNGNSKNFELLQFNSAGLMECINTLNDKKSREKIIVIKGNDWINDISKQAHTKLKGVYIKAFFLLKEEITGIWNKCGNCRERTILASSLDRVQEIRLQFSVVGNNQQYKYIQGWDTTGELAREFGKVVGFLNDAEAIIRRKMNELPMMPQGNNKLRSAYPEDDRRRGNPALYEGNRP
jgi:hypothetical protein